MKTQIEPWEIIQHSWHKTDCGGQRCDFCNSYVGIGMGSDFVWVCNPRFDEDKFQKWLNFKNFSKYTPKLKNGKPSKIERYIRRFSKNEIFTRTQLLREYKQLIKNAA